MGDAIHCDGCGTTRPSKQLPVGWVKLHVWGRRQGAIDTSKLGSVEICSFKCATKALKRYEECL